LQKKLVALGYLSRDAYQSGPGVFGPRTEAAVMSFQQANGLRATGAVGNYTRAALASAGVSRKDSFESATTQLVPKAANSDQDVTEPFVAAAARPEFMPRFNGALPAPATINIRTFEPVNAPVKSDQTDRSAARYA